MEAAAKRFFMSPYFAVVGASQNRAKFGFRSRYHDPDTVTDANVYPVFAWYHVHALKVTPINPSRSSIDLPSKSYTTVTSPTALSNPSLTALSFLTPPEVTRKALADAKSVGVKSVWLQPGSFDDETMKYAQDNFENAIGGFGQGTVGGEGWCVLVDGENALRAAGKDILRQKL